MTLTKKDLKKWQESMRIHLTETQEIAILNRFGAEPQPCEWTEQDIAVQIQNFLGCGEFVKSGRNNCGGATELPPGIDF